MSIVNRAYLLFLCLTYLHWTKLSPSTSPCRQYQTCISIVFRFDLQILGFMDFYWFTGFLVLCTDNIRFYRFLVVYVHILGFHWFYVGFTLVLYSYEKTGPHAQ